MCVDLERLGNSSLIKQWSSVSEVRFFQLDLVDSALQWSHGLPENDPTPDTCVLCVWFGLAPRCCQRSQAAFVVCISHTGVACWLPIEKLAPKTFNCVAIVDHAGVVYTNDRNIDYKNMIYIKKAFSSSNCSVCWGIAIASPDIFQNLTCIVSPASGHARKCNVRDHDSWVPVFRFLSGSKSKKSAKHIYNTYKTHHGSTKPKIAELTMNSTLT